MDANRAKHTHTAQIDVNFISTMQFSNIVQYIYIRYLWPFKKISNYITSKAVYLFIFLTCALMDAPITASTSIYTAVGSLPWFTFRCKVKLFLDFLAIFSLVSRLCSCDAVTETTLGSIHQCISRCNFECTKDHQKLSIWFWNPKKNALWIYDCHLHILN